MEVEDRTLLVTGAAGFIGSHLAEALVEEGASILGVDCLSEYYSPVLKRKNLQNLQDTVTFEFFERNLLDLDLTELLERVDGVFHLAAQAGVRSSWGAEFDEYIHQNIRATQYLLEATKQVDADCPIILASSSSVYGIPRELPMHEEMRPVPHSPYGVTKLAAENLGMLYGRNFNLPICTLRFFTVFGPRQRPDMAFSRFLTWVYRGEPITVYGDGSQTRDFSYVEDVTDALIESYRQEAWGEVYNVGGGNRVSVNETLETIETVSEKPVKRVEKPMPKGDVPHTDADTERIRSELNWTPDVSLEEGLRHQWKWVRDRSELREAISSPDFGSVS